MTPATNGLKNKNGGLYLSAHERPPHADLVKWMGECGQIAPLGSGFLPYRDQGNR
jgi:hypothetical protein